MPLSPEINDPTGNKFLDALPDEERRFLLSCIEPVSLEHGQAIISPDEPIPSAYFPTGALLSLVIEMRDGSSVEAGSVGREGLAGIPILLSDEGQTPMRTVAQIPGSALRLPAKVLKEAFARGGELQKLFYRYMHALYIVAAQSAACNRLHHTSERLARWVLMSADGVGSDEEVRLTHEYLSVMLGVRRAGVTEAAVKLQEAGLIRYTRGNIWITDREGLERKACECYGDVKREYERLYARPVAGPKNP